jgi:hypothetical protein
MVTNKMKLNDSKTEVLVVVKKSQRKCVEDIRVRVGDSVVIPSKRVRNLGGDLDEELSMVTQVRSVVKSVNFHIRRIGKIRRYIDSDTCAKVINATVTSRLDYHNALLAGIPDKYLRPLQLAQNKAARLLAGTRRHEHIQPTLEHLHWLPVKQCVTFKVLTLIHKSLHDPVSPQYVKDMFTTYTPARALRSSEDPWKLEVPRSGRLKRDRCVQVLGAKLWNTLPASLRGQESVQSFKRQLKTTLFRIAYGQ